MLKTYELLNGSVVCIINKNWPLKFTTIFKKAFLLFYIYIIIIIIPNKENSSK